MSSLMNLSFAAAVAGMTLVCANPASAALIKSYDFNGDLDDSLGNGAPLSALGGNLATPGRYTFGPNQGLSLTSALPDPANYAIEIKFAVTDTQGNTYSKIIDFSGLVQDSGLYLNLGSLLFYPTSAPGADSIPLNTDVVARLERSATTNIVRGFLNDVLQWSFVDNSAFAVAGSNVLNFLVDDADTAQSEFFSGSVDYVRLFDAPLLVPEPGALGLFALGLAGLGFGLGRGLRH